jgi:hypothetical protein
MRGPQDLDVRPMMRGCTPLFAVVALLLAPPARAQSNDRDEPTPACCTTPPAPPHDSDEPMPACCTPAPQPPASPLPPVPPPLVAPMPVVACCAEPVTVPTRRLFLTLSVGPSYRRAFGDDFIAAVPEVDIGGQTHNLSIATRFSAALGATRFGLPFQFFNLGPSLMFRVSERVRFGFALNFGVFMYERATVTRNDPVVWTFSLGAALDLTVDLVRLRSGGTLFVDARLGSDWIAPLNGGFTEGLSIAPSLGFGLRL